MKQLTRRERRQRRRPLLPALIFILCMTQIPLIVTLIGSTLDWNAYYPGETEFVAFANYSAVFTDDKLAAALRNTIAITLGVVGASLALGVMIALLLNRTFVGRGLVRTLVISPFLIVPIAAALFWKHALLNPSYGAINGTIKAINSWLSLDMPTPSWITDYPVTSIIVILIWQWTPFMTLIILAGLQGINQEILEAAKVDGANSMKAFFSIKLPHLRPYLEIAAIFGAMFIVQVYDAVFTLTGGSSSTANLPYAIYQIFYIGGQYGYASAVGVIVVILSLILAILGLRTVSTMFREETS